MRAVDRIRGLIETRRYLREERARTRQRLARQPLLSLTDEEYTRWANDTGVGDLDRLLVLTWDPDNYAPEYPDLLVAYGSLAQSILHGFRVRNDLAGFIVRVRENVGLNSFSSEPLRSRPRLILHRRLALSTRRLERLYETVEAWTTNSVNAWLFHVEDVAFRALPFHAEVLKYDPVHSIDGHADDGTWTDISDIGSTFREGVLTRAEYERVEAAHVSTILAMLDESGITELQPTARAIADGAPASPIRAEEFGAELRAMLRGNFRSAAWRDPTLRFYVEVGYDYHLDAGSHRSCPEAMKLSRELGLHPREHSEIGRPLDRWPRGATASLPSDRV